MRDDPLWIDVTELMRKGTAGLGAFVTQLAALPDSAANVGEHVWAPHQLIGIMDVDLHVEEVTGSDKTLDVVVDIFNRSTAAARNSPRVTSHWPKSVADWPEAGIHPKSNARTKEWSNGRLSFQS